MQRYYGNHILNSLIDDLGSDLIFKQQLNLAEHNIYGSSRLGVKKETTQMYFIRFTASSIDTITGNIVKDSIIQETIAQVDTVNTQRVLGYKSYELSNHLGNVLAVISDKRIYLGDTTISGDTFALWDAHITSAQDYYPFGMLMPNRHWVENDSAAYKYGFNGMERYEELNGKGNSYDFGARIYDSRLGRFFSIDLFANKFHFKSPYMYGDNNPVFYKDINGDSSVVVVSGTEVKEYKSRTGEIFLMYKVSVYENMSDTEYETHRTDRTLPEPTYTTWLARDANDVSSGGVATYHSSNRYGKNNEAPPGTYFLFKPNTNGNLDGDVKYDLYLGDVNGVREIKSPDGTVRKYIAIHQYDLRDSKGCLTTCSGADTQPVKDLINAIPDLDDDNQPVWIIIEERNASSGSYLDTEGGSLSNGTKWKAETISTLWENYIKLYNESSSAFKIYIESKEEYGTSTKRTLWNNYHSKFKKADKAFKRWEKAYIEAIEAETN